MRPEVNTKISATADTLVAENKKAKMKNKEEENVNINFFSQETNSADYEVNTKDNLFLKEYILGKAEAEGIKVPEGMKINISNFKFDENIRNTLRSLQNEKFWTDAKNWAKGKCFLDTEKEKTIEEYCDLHGLSPEDKKKVLDMYRFTDVRVNIFGARMGDMFRILSQDKSSVENKVAQMKISEEDKEKILQTKEFLDNYYKIEATYNGKTYNLANLSKDDICELEKNVPEFAEFAKQQQANLRKQSLIFARKELQLEEQNEASNDSRKAAGALTAIIGVTLGYSGMETYRYMKKMKNAKGLMEYLKALPKEKRTEKINHYLSEMERRTERFGEKKGAALFERYMSKQGFKGGEEFIKLVATHREGPVKWVNPIKAFRNAKGLALLGLIGTTLIGSYDDCLGAAKDFVQDQNNFGAKTASTIGACAVVGGIATSGGIAPTIEAAKDSAVARLTLAKNGFIDKVKKPSFKAQFNALEKKNIKNVAKLVGKRAWPLLTAVLFGMAVTSSSSGSSWTSMLGTGIKFKMNGDELEKKGIISKEENTLSNTIDNFYGKNGYDAYIGKKDGITFGSSDNGFMGDWSLGVLGGATGAFISPVPYIQGPLFALQGSSETLSANLYQLIFGPKANTNKLEKAKQELVESAKIKK